MKNFFCLLALLLCTTVFAQPQQVVVGVSGNGYVTWQQDGARITQRGVTHRTNPKSIVSIYFYLHQPTTADLSLYAKGHSEIKVSYGKKDFKVNLQSGARKHGNKYPKILSQLKSNLNKLKN